MDTPKTPRRHRRVRQEPLRVRMLSLPLDWLMLLGEWWANIDHEQLLSKSSFLVALLLNVLYLLIKMYRDGVLDDPDELRALSKSSQQHLEELSLEPNSKWLFFQWWGQGVSYQLLFTMIELALILICVINTVQVFTRTKSYILFKQPTRPRYAGDNQWMLRSRNAQICQVDIAQPTPKEGNGSLLQWSVLFSAKKPQPSKDGINSSGHSLSTDGANHISSSPVKPPVLKEDRWVIRVWNPSDGSLNLFCWFSPPQIAVIYGANVSNWINDQQILSGQLLHEFTESLVDHRSFLKSNPKMSVGDDSAATFDTEADAYAHED
ncbi:hypothetical protein BASA83_010424 [Batrachochytrium salamandrivorans]|nr:hypothetical protein BASA62_003231 [Batrachochytrium salamandrivorans]KAH9266620.1 hypothetical protein BASA83_010424 [Batrachochytrium salamandrivorans]